MIYGMAFMWIGSLSMALYILYLIEKQTKEYDDE